MKCRRIEQWLSDSMDGAISNREEAKIKAHIATCPSCRAFRDQIERINEVAKNLGMKDVSPAQTQAFASQLRSALIAMEEEKNSGVLHVFRNKWVFVPASVIMIVLFILIFVFYEKGDFLDEESYVFSLGNAVEDICQDIGGDMVLQQTFNSLVSTSINEMLNTAEWNELLSWEEEFLLWEEFLEEELEDLEKEIKKDRNS